VISKVVSPDPAGRHVKAREVYFLGGIFDAEVAGSIGLVSRACAEKRRPGSRGNDRGCLGIPDRPN
jgi:hypothetical protein